MLAKLKNWILSNKLTSLLIVIILFLLNPLSLFGFVDDLRYANVGKSMNTMYESGSVSLGSVGTVQRINGQMRDYAAPSQTAPTDTSDRKVITNSGLSLLVKNVTQTIEDVKNQVKLINGYVIDYNLNKGEYGDSANLEIRIPANRLEETLTFLRSKAVKVVYENISGNDITDQYVDIQFRINRLEKTKAVLENMFDKATTVEEMMSVQNQIFSVQNQIDNWKGQLAYMDGASKTTRISISISTDELALPYTPNTSWRPELVFKEAVRSLMINMQRLGSALIWLAVYSPIIILGIWAIVIIKVIIKKLNKPAQVK